MKGGLDRDERLGVIERVPLNSPTVWQHRMIITPKQNGEPRRCVDYGPINKHAARQTHHTEGPWALASSIPAGTRKSVVDFWHGYHSVPIAVEDRHLTSFITPYGAYRYCTTPQGFLAAGDGYTDRTDRILKEVPRLKKCVDDCLLYDSDIESNITRVYEFLQLCASHGITVNPKKFQLAEETVEYVGFKVTNEGIRPTDDFLENINSFPTPSSITDVRSWFGLIAQVSYSFATAPVMLPFKHLLSSKVPFCWSPDLDAAFKASKQEILKQCEEGVKTFDPSLPTALATDWSKVGIGFWLCQKKCDCELTLPGCCPNGWQTVLCGSRYCSPAESRYAPIEGEALAARWGVGKCKFFLLGMPDFTLCLDHKPLLSILGDQELCTIDNPRLQNQKVKLLIYRYQTRHIPGKLHVVPDCLSRRPDNPHILQTESPPQQMDITNIEPGYQDALGPPTWVSPPATLAATCNVLDVQQQPSPEQSLFAALRVQPTLEEIKEAEEEELFIMATAVAAISAMDIPVYCTNCSISSCSGQPSQLITAVTWPMLEEAARKSSSYQTLHSLISSGAPEDKSAWPADLLPYYQHRNVLMPVGQVLLYHDRPLIPIQLRQQILEHLHAAHQGVTQMYARASSSVFWPNLRQDIVQLRSACQPCTYISPSNPALPPSEPEHPDFPFSSVCADFFTTDKGNYLTIVDRYSGWLSIFSLKRDDSENVIHVLREYCARWGIPEVLTTDGASVFTSIQMKSFLSRWGIRHRVSSAYYPRANKRAELGVKSSKRLILDNLGPSGSLNTDKVARALLLHRNCPDPLTGLSPAQVLFGRVLRDHLPNLSGKYQPRAEWRLEADVREKAFAKRHARIAEQLTTGSKLLPPLQCGDHVAIQDQSQPSKPGRWTRTGSVVELCGHDSILVKVDGSSRLTQRNRRFLKKITPYSTLIKHNPVPHVPVPIVPHQHHDSNGDAPTGQSQPTVHQEKPLQEPLPQLQEPHHQQPAHQTPKPSSSLPRHLREKWIVAKPKNINQLTNQLIPSR